MLTGQRYPEHRPLACYPSALSVTSDHLSRTCRAETGKALDQVPARLTLETRRLLAYTPMAVGGIAHAPGHEDSAYF